MLCYAMRGCTISCYVVLCCIVLYCIVLCYVMICYDMLCFTIPVLFYLLLFKNLCVYFVYLNMDMDIMIVWLYSCMIV